MKVEKLLCLPTVKKSFRSVVQLLIIAMPCSIQENLLYNTGTSILQKHIQQIDVVEGTTTV